MLEDYSDDPSKSYFKQYSELDDDVTSHFLIVEVEGEAVNALDLRNAIEKLEVKGLGISAVLELTDERLYYITLQKNCYPQDRR